jgi:hypothetical protein
MLKLSNLIQNTSAIAAAAAPSELAMHAFSRDANGLLTYTKALWSNTSETIMMTDGAGFAYSGIEDFISGISSSNDEFNYSQKSDAISGDRVKISNTFIVRVITSNGSPQFTVDGNSSSPNPVLRLHRGVTYTFNTEDVSTLNHPIYISTSPAGNNYATEFLQGVEYSRSANTGGGYVTINANVATSQFLTFTVPMNCANQLYYASGQDATCYGILDIQNALTDTSHRKYDQVRFDNQKLFYYINAQGYLVARYGADYTYGSIPGQS